MTEIIGTGTNGKQLWFRSPDGRWIEVPYGAGQDTTVRSVNYWNDAKKQWMTPTWGQTLRNLGRPRTVMDALDVYAPNRAWVGSLTNHPAELYRHWYNPTYQSPLVTQGQYTAPRKDWLRLMYLRERNDPNWRIVPVGEIIPLRVPNRALNVASGLGNGTPYDIHAGRFWPVGGVRLNYSLDASLTNIPLTDGKFNSGTFAMAGVSTHYEDRTVHGHENLSDYRNEIATMFDLKAIRKRLEDTYPQQSIDFTGQYTDIRQMKLKRAVFDVIVQFGSGGRGPNPPAHGMGSAALFVKQGSSGIARTQTSDAWPGSYDVRYPASTEAAGDMIWSVGAAELPVTVNEWTFDYVRQVMVYSSGGLVGHRFLHVIENPGEDNITFTARVIDAGLPPGCDESGSLIEVGAQGVSLHYATDGHDTPASTHTSTYWY